jgi:hypothetical protein
MPRKIDFKRLLISFLVGCTFSIFGLLPYLKPELSEGYGLNIFLGAMAITFMPFFVVGIVASRNFHDPNICVAAVSDFLFFAFCAHAILKKIQERRTSRSVSDSD